MRTAIASTVVMAGLMCSATGLHAQTDYRNLDAGRPMRVADARAVETYALETTVGASAARDAHGFVELTWGPLPRTQLSLAYDGVLEAGGLLMLTPERTGLPALALRAALRDGHGDVGLAATRSFGRQRLHATASVADGGDVWGGLALDRTFFRHSALAALELTGEQTAGGTRWAAGAGLRWQATPLAVLSAGVTRTLKLGDDWRGTASVSLARSGPRYATRSALMASPVAERMYTPGGFNWAFLRGYPDAARLFNAFDYGHAVLYERLLTLDSAAAQPALARDFVYLTQDLLVRPPRLAVAEETVAPSYTRFAVRANLMFHWAHVLHRQIYDVYADERLADAEKQRLVERLTDDYLADRALAFTAAPKAMALMDEQPYSQVFRRRHVAFNGLIWAYHWLQVGLYEPLLDTAQTGGRAGVQNVVARFRAMIADTANLPATMPMTAEVAPHFAARHPRAAAIFDNLHMMHDIISDILADERVPHARKAATIEAALREFQDGTRNLMEAGHHH